MGSYKKPEHTVEELAAAKEAARKAMQEAEEAARMEARKESERQELKQRGEQYFQEKEKEKALERLGRAIEKNVSPGEIEAAKKAGQEREEQENIQL